MKTLIVEDDSICREVLQNILSAYGECHVAENGRQAVDAFRLSIESDQPYQLICMDVIMPQMDGQAALNAIRRIEKVLGIQSQHGVKIIMTSALRDKQTITTAFKELCDGYLFKPVGKPQLLEKIRALGLIPKNEAARQAEMSEMSVQT